MKTYPMTSDDKAGPPLAFEIENCYISISGIADLLSEIEGVSHVRKRKLFGKWEDIHIWFSYRDVEFVVEEPFGDNSRYWIGPSRAEDRVDIGQLLLRFERFEPTAIRRILGNVLTLSVVRSVFESAKGRQ